MLGQRGKETTVVKNKEEKRKNMIGQGGREEQYDRTRRMIGTIR